MVRRMAFASLHVATLMLFPPLSQLHASKQAGLSRDREERVAKELNSTPQVAQPTHR